jgi:NADH-quinone oxidoreductase subunit M
MLNHGVSTGGLFLIVGMLSDRRHTRLIAEFGGLKAVTPRLVAAFLIITLSSIALPGLNGFVGEFLILVGAFRWDPRFAAVAALGVVLSAVYMLWMFQRVNYGPVTNRKNTELKDLTAREWWVIAPIVAAAVLMGILPAPFLRPTEVSVQRVVERVTSRQPAVVRTQGQPEPSVIISRGSRGPTPARSRSAARPSAALPSGASRGPQALAARDGGAVRGPRPEAPPEARTPSPEARR